MNEPTPVQAAVHLRRALRVAYRHFSTVDTTEAERESILVSVAEKFSGEEGETAARMLHHRREAEALQFKLDTLLIESGRAEG